MTVNANPSIVQMHAKYVAGIFNKAKNLSMPIYDEDKEPVKNEKGEMQYTPGLASQNINSGLEGPRDKFRFFGLSREPNRLIPFKHGLKPVRCWRKPTEDEHQQLIQQNPGVGSTQLQYQDDFLIFGGSMRLDGLAARQAREEIWEHDQEQFEGDLTPLVLASEIREFLTEEGAACLLSLCKYRKLSEKNIVIVAVGSMPARTGYWTNNWLTKEEREKANTLDLNEVGEKTENTQTSDMPF